MKKRTTVRSHLRKTKRGPKIVRRHPRMVRAKMAEWESEVERENIQTELDERRAKAKKLASTQLNTPYESWKTGFDEGRAHGFEAALLHTNLLPSMDSKKVVPFKRAKMQRARMAGFKKLPSREFMDEEPRFVDVPVEMKTREGRIKKYWPTYNKYGKFIGFEYD